MKAIYNIVMMTLLFLCMNATGLRSQTIPAVQHKIGAYYSDLKENGMQKTHEYKSVVYVNPSTAGSSFTLALPSRNNTTPHFYFRWYDYDTDGMSDCITPPSSVSPLYTQTNGYLTYGGPLFETVSYKVDPDLLPHRIACDVSAYMDYETDGNGYITVEPTLSYRVIYELRDANEMAIELRDKTAQGEFMEEIEVYMPANPASDHQDHRVTLRYDDSNYYGYDGRVVPDLYRGSLVITGDRYKSKSGRFLYVEPGPANTSTEIEIKLSVGTQTNNRIYNVTKYIIHFIEDSPEEFTDTGYRSIEYLDENYVLINQLDFDYDTEPATAANNMWQRPLDWDICEYGFTSETLFSQNYRGFGNKVSQWNEYGFYKTANVSMSGLTGYTWYNSGKQVYDRRYFTSNGKEQGYFMYIDAAQTPGVVAKLPIEKLCGGTRLIVSAGVASLTQSGATSYPNLNLVFVGIDADGNETELNRYTSGDIPSTAANVSVTPWYQLYYTFTFDSDTEYVSYAVQVENNCTSTGGGDYAVDDIRIYRSKPAVQAYQLNFSCDEEETKVKMRIQYDKLLSAIGQSEVTSGSGNVVPLKFKILDKNLNPIDYNYGTVTNPESGYGQISISSRFDEMTVLTSGYPPVADNDLNKLAYTEIEILEEIEERYVVFLIPTSEGLKVNEDYYMVVADDNNYFDTGICSLISDPFALIPLYAFTMDGSPWIEGDGLCYGNPVTVGVKLRDITNPEVEVEALFDWYLGNLEEFQEIISGTGYSVETALRAYRSVYPAPSQGDALSTTYQGSYTTAIHDLLAEKIAEGKLILNEPELTKVLRQGNIILALPLLETADLPSGTDIADLCDNTIIIIASGPAKNPTIELGNEYFENLRMGRVQFTDLVANSSKTVKIPVYDFLNSDDTKDRNLAVSADNKLYVVATNDANFVIDPYETGTFVEIAEINNIQVSGSSNDHIVFQVPSTVGFTPREGYNYTLEFHFRQVPKPNEGEICDGTARFSVNIVPEYLTWTGENGDNWNNDENWRRSLKEELYKSDYTDDPDAAGYVPMEFSKVTILSTQSGETNNYPWLYQITGNPYLNLDNTNYTTAAEKEANAATPQIEYDLVLTDDGNNYVAANFYGNTADQIYFKPGAEMRHTNYLAYNKAHVDFELYPGRWYMLASPLQGTFAGDMYLPSENGRQETEAFAPITYSTTANDRFSPAVYQRSWDQANSIVFQHDGTQEDAYLSAQWSMVYNQVDEEYIPGKGFSIRTVMDTDQADSVLFRIPKDDDNYIYYSYDGSLMGNPTPMNRSKNGRLAFESPMADITVSLQNDTGNNSIFLVGNPFMASLDMEKFFDDNPGLDRKYWIYTGSGLSGIQFNTDGTVTTTGDEILSTTIPPMQSFFVERTDGANVTTIAFDPEMTVISDNTALRVRTRANQEEPDEKVLRISAIRNGLKSNLIIRKKDNGMDGFDPDEDMKVIIDPHWIEVPVLYSMSDNVATIINTINEQDNIPIGIFSDDDSDVIVTFEGVEEWGQELWFYDKFSGESTLLDRSVTSLIMSGNNYGRYFIQTLSEIEAERRHEYITAYSGQRGMLNIESDSSDPIQTVRIYGIDGMVLQELTKVNNNVLYLELPSQQIYVVTVETLHHRLHKKVYCN